MKLRQYFLCASIIFVVSISTNMTAAPIPTKESLISAKEHVDSSNNKVIDKKSRLELLKEKRKALRKIKAALRNKAYFVKDFEQQLLSSDCKTLTLKTGEVLRVLVVSMDELQLSYIPCDGTNEEEKIILFTDIEELTADDGDLIYKAPKIGSEDPETEMKVMVFSWIAISLSILSIIPPLGLIFGPLAIIFASVALNKINKKEASERHRKIAKGGLIGGMIICALYLFLLFALVF